MAAPTDLPPFEKNDLLIVVSFAVISGLLKEVLAHILIYRRNEYKVKFKQLCDRYEDYYRTTVVFELPTSNSNCVTTASQALLAAIKDVKKMHTFYTIASGLIFMILMLFVMSYFEGCVVAKLPFTPIYPLYLFTQGDTAGEDRTNCSATCIYTMLSMAVKDVLQVLLGFRSPLTPFTELTLSNSLENEKDK